MARKPDNTDYTPIAPDATTVVARETSPSAETSLQIHAPPDNAPQVIQSEGGVAVWMPPESAQGIRAFGELLPGTVYTVAPAEALRLVTAKRFRFASSTDQVRVSDHIDGIADALNTTQE